MKKITCFFVFSLFYSTIYTQVTNTGEPLSWGLSGLNSVYPEIMEEVVVDNPDPENVKTGEPYKFGEEIPVQLTMHNSGTWDDLGNAGRLWRLRIQSTGATSLNFVFNQFYLPQGATLYLYSNDKTDMVGAYTDAQNREDGQLGTWFISGDDVWIEYFEPAEHIGQGQLSLHKVVHGFRPVDGRGLNDSSQCHYDVNCSVGNDYDEIRDKLKRSVAFFIMGGNMCSGTLINNAENDKAPYFLTANHCDDDNPGTWAFRFNWVSPNPICGEEGDGGSSEYNQTISGATKIMSNSKTDVMLLKIQGNLPNSWNLHWAGWNRSSEEIPDFTVSIHHPMGDVMKICRDNHIPSKVEATFSNHPEVSLWQISNWEVGLTESGSSGGALFDHYGRIIGQLAGGMSACENGNNNGMPDYFGRFDVSWDYGKTPETRLSDWLDPNHTGVVVTDGLSSPVLELTASLSVFPNPASTTIHVNNNNYAGLTFTLYNVIGQKISGGQLTQSNNTIDVSSLSEGSFFLHLFDTESSNSVVKHIIIKH